MIKKILAGLLFGVWLVSLFIFSVNAMDIDGVMDEAAWKSAYKITLFTSSQVSNCNAGSAVLSIVEEPKTNRLIFGFKVKLNETIEDSTAYGAAISVNSSQFIVVQSNLTSDFDNNLFGLDYAIEVTGEDSFCAEIAVGLKYGLETLEKIDVRVLDANGNPSTVFEVDYTVMSNDNPQSEIKVTETTVHNTEIINTTTDKETEVKTTKEKHTSDKTTKSSKNKVTKKKTQHYESVNESTVNSEYTHSYSSITIDNDEANTTSLNTKQVNFYKGTFKVMVIIIVLLALCVCVAVNVIRNKNKN